MRTFARHARGNRRCNAECRILQFGLVEFRFIEFRFVALDLRKRLGELYNARDGAYKQALPAGVRRK